MQKSQNVKLNYGGMWATYQDRQRED